MNPSNRPTGGARPQWAILARIAATCLILLLGAWLRFHGLDAQGLWDDEGISYARAILPLGTMLSLLPDEQMPGYYAALHAWIRLFGDDVWTMRALSAICGIVAILAIYLVGRRWFGRRTGLLAALLMAISPSAIRQSQTLRMYPMLVAALLLAAATGTRALRLLAKGDHPRIEEAKDGRERRAATLALLAYVIAATCVAMTHLIGLLGIATLSVWALWTYRRDRRAIQRWLWAQAPVVLVPAIWLLYGLMFSPAGEMLSRTGGSPPHPLALGSEAIMLLGAAWGSPATPLSALAGVLVGGLAILGMWRPRMGRRESQRALLWMMPGASFAALCVLGWLMDAPLYWHYLAPLAPWAYLAAGLGLTALARLRAWAHWLALFAVVAAMAINVSAYSQRPKEDLAPLAARIAANAQPGDAIVHSSKWRAQCFHYYDESGLSASEEPDAVEIGEITARAQRIWLLVYGYRPTKPIGDALMAAHPQVGNWPSGTTQLMLYVSSQAPSQMTNPLHADLGPIRLLGYDLAPEAPAPGEVVRLTLWWQSTAKVEPGYKIFIHLEDASGHIWGQRDAEPMDGLRPTWTWEPGEVIADPHAFAIDSNAPLGDYRLLVGLYDLPTGQRLPILGADAPHDGGALLLRELRLSAAP